MIVCFLTHHFLNCFIVHQYRNCRKNRTEDCGARDESCTNASREDCGAHCEKSRKNRRVDCRAHCVGIAGPTMRAAGRASVPNSPSGPQFTIVLVFSYFILYSKLFSFLFSFSCFILTVLIFPIGYKSVHSTSISYSYSFPYFIYST